MTESQTNTVLVYVRLCGDDASRECREISFKIPDKLSQKDLLEEGFAIDGNSAMKAVTPYDDFQLSDVLHNSQLDLVKWLGQRGYAVEFK